MAKHLLATVWSAIGLIGLLLVHACGGEEVLAPSSYNALPDTAVNADTQNLVPDSALRADGTVDEDLDGITTDDNGASDTATQIEDSDGTRSDTAPPSTEDTNTATDTLPEADEFTPEDTSLQDVTLDDIVDAQDISTEPFDTGLEPLPDTAPPGPPPEWLLSIDNGTKVLQRVNITTGATTDLCDLYDPTLGAIPSYPSLTFSRNNFLYASRGGTALDLIDPCTCEIEQLGSYGGWSGVNGITSDKGIQLLGAAATQDELISIQTKTGVGTLIGDLGANFTTHGATWSDGINGLYAINGLNNGLYTIDPLTGLATFQVTLSMNFGTVGIELLPANGVIYACSSEANLLSIDPVSGVVTTIGSMNQSGACTNLAAPWKAVPCIEP
jgi:hypothetical protein